jgi:hypothetical protein
MTGQTYSTTHYNEFKRTGNQNIFEEVVDSMVLDGVSGMNESFKRAISNLPRSEKRMTILSLLDKDLNLFKKIKALTNKDINRLDHIKDVIIMLRDYVKVGDVEKKKFGEVMTPLSLVKEMLSTLPEETWSNPNLKILDPANGTGPYPAVVIYKLMKGLENWEPDTEKRYKHIIENMIYTCELQAKNVFLWLCVADPFDEYETNTYWGSFLDEGFDKHMKEVWDVDKFDIVVGNPPFNTEASGDFQTKDLYDQFTIKSINLINKYVLFITPARWMNKNNKSEYRKKIVKNRIIKNKIRFEKTGYRLSEKTRQKMSKASKKKVDKQIAEGRNIFVGEIGSKFASERNKKLIDENRHNFQKSTVAVDKKGNRVTISTELFWSQTGLKEDWEYVHHTSNIGKQRLNTAKGDI